MPLLVARCFCLLVVLCEHEQPGLLDTLVTRAASKGRLQHIVDAACQLLGAYMQRSLHWQSGDAGHGASAGGVGGASSSAGAAAAGGGRGSREDMLMPGEAQLLLASLRLVELASDDSTLRERTMMMMARPVVALLGGDREVFEAK